MSESDAQRSLEGKTHMVKIISLLVVVLVSSACATPPTALPTDSAPELPDVSTTPPSVTTTTSPAPTIPSRQLASVPGGAKASADGKWIAAMEPAPTGRVAYEPTLLIFSSDGTLVRKVVGVYIFTWLPDSSGLLVATSVPQRAPDLSIVELDGRIVQTQVQMADATLTRDGKWIVAEHQEGCCVAIVQREIRASSRDGRTMRTLARSQATDPQPVSLIGIDSTDRVVYRDGDRLMRVPLTGGAAEVVASSADLVGTVGASTSPDGLAMLVRGYQPDRWFVLANGRLASWDAALGEPVTDLSVVLTKGTLATTWTGPHTLLVRAANGALSGYDPIAATRHDYPTRLTDIDTVFGYGHGAVLVMRGDRPILIDLADGAIRETSLKVGLDSRGLLSSTLPGGGFLISSSTATYRLD